MRRYKQEQDRWVSRTDYCIIFSLKISDKMRYKHIQILYKLTITLIVTITILKSGVPEMVPSNFIQFNICCSTTLPLIKWSDSTQFSSIREKNEFKVLRILYINVAMNCQLSDVVERAWCSITITEILYVVGSNLDFSNIFYSKTRYLFCLRFVWDVWSFCIFATCFFPLFCTRGTLRMLVYSSYSIRKKLIV